MLHPDSTLPQCYDVLVEKFGEHLPRGLVAHQTDEDRQHDHSIRLMQMQ